MTKAAVIGAGAAGLSALRHLVARPQISKAVAFEQMPVVGGTWVYTEKKGKDEHGLPIHSSMYKNLKTNLPKEVMAYPDYQFKDEIPSFLTHGQVKNYLADYSHNFGLNDHIKFGTSVQSVKPVEQGGKTKWSISTHQVGSANKDAVTEVFDSVFVCNGHYSIPDMPNIPGQDTFTGEILHSHDFRHPEAFKDKRVLVLGAGASGQDIALDIGKFAKKVTLGHNKAQMRCPFPKNINQRSGIKEINGNSVTFIDDSSEEYDAIMFSTGYQYTFPFLAPECGITVKNQRISPLYKHLFHIERPSMYFIGMCAAVCPFQMFDLQVRVSMKHIMGEFQLPSKEKMYLETEKDLEWRRNMGWPERHAHKLADHQWQYADELVAISGATPIRKVIKDLFRHVHNIRQTDIQHYKRMNFEIVNDEDYTIVERGYL